MVITTSFITSSSSHPIAYTRSNLNSILEGGGFRESDLDKWHHLCNSQGDVSSFPSASALVRLAGGKALICAPLPLKL